MYVYIYIYIYIYMRRFPSSSASKRGASCFLPIPKQIHDWAPGWDRILRWLLICCVPSVRWFRWEWKPRFPECNTLC